MLPGTVVGAPGENGEKTTPKGLVLIGALASPEERTALRDLYASVLIAMQGSMESSMPDRCPKGRELCFQRVESYDDLIRRARMTNQIADRGYLELATMNSVIRTSKLELSGYVGIQLMKLDQGFALEAVIFDEKLQPFRRKFVTATSGAGELVQLATELGQRIALGTQTAPILQLGHENSRDVQVGSDVVLDASPSQDFDFDHLYWRWKQVGGPSVLPPDGSVRSTLHFVPPQAGTYRFEVEVRDRAASSESGSSFCTHSGEVGKLLSWAREQPWWNETRSSVRAVIVKAGAEPKLKTFESEIIEKAPAEVTLKGECAKDDVCTWAQIEGPPTSLSRREQSALLLAQGCGESSAPKVAPESASEQPVKFTHPGLYRFQWRVTNCFGTATAVKTILVAPPPVPMADVPSIVFLGNGAILDGSGSYDPLGSPLTYLWTATRDAKKGDTKAQACAVSAENESRGFYVTTPTESEAVLRAANLGVHSVALTVTTTRKVDDQVVVQSVCVPKEVRIIPRRFELQPLGGMLRWDGIEKQTAVGMLIAGSVAVGGEWRMHVQQVLFRHVQTDGGNATTEAFGGTRLLSSYSARFEPLVIRPGFGLELRAVGDSGDAWGPRAALDVGIDIGNRFILVLTGGADILYYFGKKAWGVSPDLALAFGITL